MRSHHSAQSKSFLEKKRRRTAWTIAAAVISLVSWAFVISRVSALPILTIDDVHIYGADRETLPKMHAAVVGTLAGDYLGVFSKANTFMYPKHEIAAVISSTSPRIETVKIKRSGLRALAISITEKTPTAVVCADLPDLEHVSEASSEKCYFADSDGLIFKNAPKTDLASYNLFYIPELTGKDISGKYATTTAAFKDLQNLINGIKAAGIEAQSLLIKEGGEYELYAKNLDGESIVVVHLTDGSGIENQRENLIAFWQKMTADARAQGKTLEWNEIKLQYPPNVYYTTVK